MLSAKTSQITIHSRYAYARTRDLARATGKTVTQVIEEALRAYDPQLPIASFPRPRGWARRGKFIVLTGGPPVAMSETLASIEADRDERGDLAGC